MKEKKADIITAVAVTVVFNILILVGLFFHEPWFDEAQAYLIARDASLHDILMYWTHYEGHPPLWHLLLKTAAAIGLPFETALKSVNFIFAEAFILITEFRSPFSRLTKILVPMSSFFLYQYSVVSRPYMMLTFFCLLAASCYKERREKPFGYCAALILMCMAHSYGIALAGGIVIADMVGEAVRERSVKKMAAGILGNKKQLISYVILLVCALALAAVIMPYSDTYAVKRYSDGHGFAYCYLLSWLLIPSETVLTSFSSEMLFMQEENNPINEVMAAAAISLIMWALLFFICKKRRMIAELLIPYSLIAVITSIYTKTHNYGIFLMFALFILWTAQEKEKITLKEFSVPLEKLGIKEKLTKTAAVCAVTAFAGVNLYWNALSYYREVKLPYDPARDLAQWIKDNDLENDRLLSSWSKSDAYIVNAASTASNAYFDKNIYYNMNFGLPFISHKICDGDKAVKVKDEWRAAGKPDFMFCDIPMEASFICEELGLDESYIAIAYIGKGRRIFKDKCENTNVYVLCTKEKYKELYGKEYEVQTYKKS